jgi:hypothetical protein
MLNLRLRREVVREQYESGLDIPCSSAIFIELPAARMVPCDLPLGASAARVLRVKQYKESARQAVKDAVFAELAAAAARNFFNRMGEDESSRIFAQKNRRFVHYAVLYRMGYSSGNS